MQWDEVAEALGGGRTPAACLAQYQQKHKGTELLNSRWTPEEATRLAQVIARLGTRDWQVGTPLHLSPLCNTRRNFQDVCTCSALSGYLCLGLLLSRATSMFWLCLLSDACTIAWYCAGRAGF